MEESDGKLARYFKDLSKKTSRTWTDLNEKASEAFKKLNAWLVENKTPVVGIVLALVLFSGGYWLFSTPMTASTTPDYIPEQKITLPYIVQNRDLSIELEYAWIDDVLSSAWDCPAITTPPRARLSYTVKNHGETFDGMFYLPVPDYLYPDQFQTPASFTWTDGLYMVMDDAPIRTGGNRTYEFIVTMQPYLELCKTKNEMDAYGNEVENKYDQLSGAGMPTDKFTQIQQAFLSFQASHQSITNLVQTARGGDPSLTLASMDKLSTYDYRQQSLLSRAVVLDEYSYASTEGRFETIVQTVSTPNEQVLQEIADIKAQLQKQLDEPSLEDLLRAYYNVSQ